MTIRWKSSKKDRIEKLSNDKRIIRKLLIFPKSLNGETRWLGIESIMQVWCDINMHMPEIGYVKVKGWKDEGWMN